MPNRVAERLYHVLYARDIAASREYSHDEKHETSADFLAPDAKVKTKKAFARFHAKAFYLEAGKIEFPSAK